MRAHNTVTAVSLRINGVLFSLPIIMSLLHHNLIPQRRLLLDKLIINQIYLVTVDFSVDIDSDIRWRQSTGPCL